jgi:hypothetical protein
MAEPTAKLHTQAVSPTVKLPVKLQVMQLASWGTASLQESQMPAVQLLLALIQQQRRQTAVPLVSCKWQQQRLTLLAVCGA